MNFAVNINNKSVIVELINKKNIKHCYLSIKNSKNLQIRAHAYFTKRDALSLIERKEQWLYKHILNFENKESLRQNDYYLGEIIEKNIEDVDAFYKDEATKILPQLVDKHAKKMELFPTSLKFRKNKTRFGSCSSKNAISLNILLMKYPLEVIEYVIIHELAHIKHKNHSSRFWGLVEQFCSNYKALDQKLKMF